MLESDQWQKETIEYGRWIMILNRAAKVDFTEKGAFESRRERVKE